MPAGTGSQPACAGLDRLDQRWQLPPGPRLRRSRRPPRPAVAAARLEPPRCDAHRARGLDRLDQRWPVPGDRVPEVSRRCWDATTRSSSLSRCPQGPAPSPPAAVSTGSTSGGQLPAPVPRSRQARPAVHPAHRVPRSRDGRSATSSTNEDRFSAPRQVPHAIVGGDRAGDLALLHAQGRRLRQRVDDVDVARHHEVRHPRGAGTAISSAAVERRAGDCSDHGHLDLVLAALGGHARPPRTPRSPGWASTSASTSKEEMFSPRRRIASFIRSTKKKLPSSSRGSRRRCGTSRCARPRPVASGMSR